MVNQLTNYTLVWPKKLKVGNAWLHKAALVTHKKISLCAKFRTEWTIFRGNGKESKSHYNNHNQKKTDVRSGTGDKKPDYHENRNKGQFDNSWNFNKAKDNYKGHDDKPRCYECGLMGHYRKDCKNKNKRTGSYQLNAIGMTERDEESEEAESIEIGAYGEVVMCCMVPDESKTGRERLGIADYCSNV